MSTQKQILGKLGEKLVVQKCICPKCKSKRTLRRLPNNFKCADVICDFCGYLAQVKTHSSLDVTKIPKRILGAAWKVQKQRMDAGIYFPLFLVLWRSSSHYSIRYLSADVQEKGMFRRRKPLSSSARRAGWQGFVYDFSQLSKGGFVTLLTT